jgi:hypothetical protein
MRCGVAFLTSHVVVTTVLSCSVVNCSIFLFVITAAIYRQAIKDFKPTCFAVILLPDILLNTMLGL